jgi:uncharacterized protein (TIGR01777 family)
LSEQTALAAPNTGLGRPRGECYNGLPAGAIIMRFVITGASGFLGRPLCALLVEQGHSVTALSRNAERASLVLGSRVSCLTWGGTPPSGSQWERAVAEADVVVHLAGEPVAAKAWTPEVKAELKRSRVETTRSLVDVMRASACKPEAFICASGINYYGDGGEETLTEASPFGSTFLAQLSMAWEHEAQKAEEFGVRVVRHRIGVVLERGGPLDKILRPLPVPISPWALGLGGPIGNGRQWFPWIHLEDAVRMFVWSSADTRVTGPVNTVSPNLIRNLDFTRALARTMHRPAFFPIPGFVLKAIVGDFADELISSQKAVPTAAQKLGFEYRYPGIDEALRSILEKPRR